jgi:hypothetical protein
MGTVQVSDDKASIEIVKNGPNTVEVNSQKPRSSVTIGVSRTSVVEKIDQGPSGPPNVLTVGTVTSGTPAVTITGVAPAQVLNFVLPISGSYAHTQSVASATWTITHNLGYRPAVSVVDSGGNYVIGDVNYISANSLTISFSSPFGGSAYLS